MLFKVIKFKIVITVVAIILVVSSLNILGGYFYLPGPLKQEKIIIIKKGLSIHKISKLLAENKVIKYPYLFEVLATIYAKINVPKSGEYKFTIGMSPYQVLRTLASGKSVIHRLFIPEGYIVSQITEQILNEERLVGRINSNIPEGCLMPSTYFYSYGDLRDNLIDQMRNNMSHVLDELTPKLAKNSPIKNRKQLLILASIIEKEAGNNAEKPIIASVFINRLRKGMKLQADPTTAYAITEGKYKLKRRLLRSDLKIESDYNTYHIYGLPKGAICCPGRKSLEAVVFPAKTNYLYFVVSGNGGHNFATTLKQHNINIQKYKNMRKK
ncbi:MAG: endolytic transglycosylase MltG [Rickettsiaceae bacterium]|nr:endolytic transglycosylase MltG [Rickettsiaceae bacterium]